MFQAYIYDCLQPYIDEFTVCYLEDILIVTAQAGTVIPGNDRRKIRVVRKELCYGKAETLEDVEKAARWWRYNLVKIKKRSEVLRCRTIWRDCYDKE